MGLSLNKTIVPMADEYNLNRFIEAQINIYETALNEIKRGKKSNHWMWYVFPQYKGLGYSSMSKRYSISCTEEALLYFHHPILGVRLLEMTNAFLKLENTSAFDVFGDPDYLKMKSCMTLFDSIQAESSVFAEVLDKYYAGSICHSTIAQIALK
jgi:uncharacterized protein (DUF1810 family)